MPRAEEKEMFRDFMEEYNTATLPHRCGAGRVRCGGVGGVGVPGGEGGDAGVRWARDESGGHGEGAVGQGARAGMVCKCCHSVREAAP